MITKCCEMFQIVGVNVTKNDQMFKWTVKQLSKQIFWQFSGHTIHTREMAHGTYRTMHVVQCLTCEIKQGLLFSFTRVSLWDVTGRCPMKCKNARHLVKWSSVLMHVFHFLSQLCSHAGFHACAWLLCWGTQHFHLICFVFFPNCAAVTVNIIY